MTTIPGEPEVRSIYAYHCEMCGETMRSRDNLGKTCTNCSFWVEVPTGQSSEPHRWFARVPTPSYAGPMG